MIFTSVCVCEQIVFVFVSASVKTCSCLSMINCFRFTKKSGKVLRSSGASWNGVRNTSGTSELQCAFVGREIDRGFGVSGFGFEGLGVGVVR